MESLQAARKIYYSVSVEMKPVPGMVKITKVSPLAHLQQTN